MATLDGWGFSGADVSELSNNNLSSLEVWCPMSYIRWRNAIKSDKTDLEGLVPGVREIMVRSDWTWMRGALEPKFYRMRLCPFEDKWPDQMVLPEDEAGALHTIQCGTGKDGLFIEGWLDDMEPSTARLTFSPDLHTDPTETDDSPAILRFARCVFGRAYCAGDKLRITRQSRGDTQRDVADSIGCSVSAVRSWEQGRRHPKSLYRRAVQEYITDSECDTD